MQSISLRYLGSAAAEGWPALYCQCDACTRARLRGGKDIRTRSQAIINEDLLIDLPADTMSHINRFGINMGNIDHLLVTHAHLDHFYPYDLHLRIPPYAHGIAPLHVYCNETVRGAFIATLEDYLSHWREFIQFHILHAFDIFHAGAYEIEALRADHNPKEECLFYRIVQNHQSILYAHDTGYFPEDTWSFLKGKYCDIVSLDCTYCLEESCQAHMGLSTCVSVRNRMMECRIADDRTRFVINHFTHNCAHNVGYKELAEAASKEGFLTSYDGFEITCIS